MVGAAVRGWQRVADECITSTGVREVWWQVRGDDMGLLTSSLSED